MPTVAGSPQGAAIKGPMEQTFQSSETQMFKSIQPPRKTLSRFSSSRRFAGAIACAVAASLLLGGASNAFAQTPVPAAAVDPTVQPAPIDPGFSTMGVFMDANGPVYAVTNLEKTSWNGISVIIGNFYNFETDALNFLVVIPAAPGSVVWFSGTAAGVLYVFPDDPTETHWSDNRLRSGTYIPI
jgi:hypothetical protein